MDGLTQPWPWWVAGPLLGLTPAALLLLGNRMFGVSSNLRHACAALLPKTWTRGAPFLQHDWRGEGTWNLAFALGILLGGFFAGTLWANPDPVAISDATRQALAGLGVDTGPGLAPANLFSWVGLGTASGFVLVVVGGWLVGFGTAYAGGCTSGHGLTGIADLQLPSVIALVAFFVGGILSTHVILPLVLR